MLNKDIINKIFVYTNNHIYIKDFHKIMYPSTIKHLLQDKDEKFLVKDQPITKFEKCAELIDVNWNQIAASGNLTINFIMKFAEKLDWIILCQFQEFSIAELELFILRLYSGLENITIHTTLPRYYKFLPHWRFVCNKKFTITLIINIYRISFTAAFKLANSNLTEETINHYRNADLDPFIYPNHLKTSERFVINHINVKEHFNSIIANIELSSIFLNKFKKDFIENRRITWYLIAFYQKLSLDFIRENKHEWKNLGTIMLERQVLDKPLIIHFLKNCDYPIMDPTNEDILEFCIPDHSKKDKFIEKYGA